MERFTSIRKLQFPTNVILQREIIETIHCQIFFAGTLSVLKVDNSIIDLYIIWELRNWSKRLGSFKREKSLWSRFPTKVHRNADDIFRYVDSLNYFLVLLLLLNFNAISATISDIFTGISTAKMPKTRLSTPRNLITHSSRTSSKKPVINRTIPKFLIDHSFIWQKRVDDSFSVIQSCGNIELLILSVNPFDRKKCDGIKL